MKLEAIRDEILEWYDGHHYGQHVICLFNSCPRQNKTDVHD